ncbi:MAG TPA: helix-turn-helix domain-containing protein [Steroidobacteraceae bacterium]|jgi:hypothetical protein|nr:helix-turn-helix domain-containing protein [Steroidobacteraceae bacterium]
MEKADRNRRVLDLAELGFSDREIAAQFRITPARVAQIIKRYGGGPIETARLRKRLERRGFDAPSNSREVRAMAKTLF